MVGDWHFWWIPVESKIIWFYTLYEEYKLTPRFGWVCQTRVWECYQFCEWVEWRPTRFQCELIHIRMIWHLVFIRLWSQRETLSEPCENSGKSQQQCCLHTSCQIILASMHSDTLVWQTHPNLGVILYPSYKIISSWRGILLIRKASCLSNIFDLNLQ